jgi:serine/threonine protein kinase
MARLIWKLPDGTSREFVLADAAILGRDAGADCVLDSKGTSRRHARIERRPEGFFVRDLGSTNGTCVNGRKLEREVRLEPGDRIQVGDTELEFEADQAPGLPRGALATEPLSRTLRFEEAAASKTPPSGCLPEMLPRRAGKFLLLDKLGQGGMGAVYRARDLDSSREVAVKFIRSQIGRREAFLEFFHNREAVLAREIDHPNVIRVYEHGVEQEHHYISMEFVRGQNLYHAMKRGRFSPADVLEILRQVACGLAAAHRQGVVHSDIKPANILLLEDHLVRAGRGDELAEPIAEDPPSEILEFESEPPPGATSSANGGAGHKSLEPALLEEIQRRVGRPAREMLVDPPYFQRPSELRFLEHYLEGLKNRGGYFVLVEGEAGVGKKRLISEFMSRRKEPREGDEAASVPRFLELDCSRIEGIPLFYEQLTGSKPGAELALRQVVELIKQRAEESSRPTVIRVLELGKASPLACHLISHWLSRMEEQPLFLLASLEREEIRDNNSVKALLEHLHPRRKELYLRPLTEYQIQRYLQELFRDSLSGLDLAADLYRLSGGNFARLLDLLRSFFDRGILKTDQPSGRLIYRPSFREFELEEGKNLYEKYRAYGKVEQQILEQAAFIGSRFFFDVLLRLVNIEETSLFFVARHFLADGFVSEENRTWYRFTNAAFQRYMAERIPPPERPHLHRKISRLLESVPVGESAELFHLRAHHYAGCHEYGKAVQSFLEAAHLARTAHQSDLAREMYQEILRIYRQLSSRESARKGVTGILREWFRRDGNWYEILGELGAEDAQAWVKIADFGISFRESDEERGYLVGRRPVLGTPRYLAPERGRGESGGPRSDIFSLGIIAYEMVVGEPPFPGLKGAQVSQAYQQKQVIVPPEQAARFPAGFGELMQGMLEIDASRRWDAERVIREVVKLQFDLKMNRRGESEARRG